MGTPVRRRILLLDPDRADEALEVEVLACDEAVLAVAMPNTIVSFDLIRQDDRAYRGWLGGRSFLFIPAPSQGSNSESVSDREVPTRARSRRPRNPTPEDGAAPQLRGAGRKGAYYGGTG
jgi:hypothetical protein